MRAQALIDGRVLCVHGGLSPDLRTLDQVGTLVALLSQVNEVMACAGVSLGWTRVAEQCGGQRPRRS